MKRWALLAILGVLCWAASAQAQSIYDANRNLQVNCVVGCSAGSGTGSNNADAVATVSTGLGTSQAFIFGFNGTTWDRLRDDGSKNLMVNCAVGCAGGTFSNASDAVATSSTNGQTAAWLYAFNGTTFDRLRDDGSKNLLVNCAVGCSAGTFSNSSDAVATSSTNGQAAAWLYAFNGTTWDRLRDDGSKNLDVNLQTALPGGANTIGAVNQAGAPWSQNLTQVGSAAIALGQTTMASSIPVAIASNQSAVPASQSGSWTVTANAGTGNFAENLVQIGGNAVVTGASGLQQVGIVGNAGAVMDFAGQNAVQPANSLLAAGEFNTAPTTITTGHASPLQLDSAANLLVNLKTALPAGGNTIGAVTQASGPWTENLTQIGGAAYAEGSTTSSASAPVVVANDQGIVPGLAAPGCAGQTVANTLTKPFSNAGSANNLLLVTGTAAKKVHICGINFGPVAAALNAALVEGTTTTNPCDTGTAGLMGGATAATGWQLAANGGLTYGDGIGVLAVEATNADNVCLLFSAGVQASGVITYATF